MREKKETEEISAWAYSPVATEYLWANKNEHEVYKK